ncbi:hypothetical protein OG568_08615 [Streptomyces sp. NBC_01450]|uniref:hypothetical protein n=1 Tax=Streptomyces sp. NBC_01450 TaxID=2903871 RepID=UPI002E380772|nr:hypothetical protein [Streptomyces sp. NBC_01450]
MAIARRLTTRLGGAITTHGKAPEGGACFAVQLPPRPGTATPDIDSDGPYTPRTPR